jgi:mannose-6-phosphate isomerase-like protein (cupin superfamily)
MRRFERPAAELNERKLSLLEDREMPVIDNASVKAFNLPGLHHRTFAGPEHGLKNLEVWGQVIEAGAGTPVHRHTCEEAIVVLEGSGTLTIDGEQSRFGPNSTLIIPADAVHQIVNSGTTRMVIVAALSMAPVQVRHADNRAMPLPWQAS